MASNSRARSLTYVGPESLSGVPARDLTPDDLERLAAKPYTKRRLAKSPEALADLLISTHLYKAASASPKEE